MRQLFCRTFRTFSQPHITTICFIFVSAIQTFQLIKFLIIMSVRHPCTTKILLIVFVYISRIGCFHFKFISHSFSLKPTSIKSSSITNGRFTSIPSLARSFNISSSDIEGSLFLRSRDLYNSPLVLKNFLSGKPLFVNHSVNSSSVGLSIFISLNSYSILLSSSHLRAF